MYLHLAPCEISAVSATPVREAGHNRRARRRGSVAILVAVSLTAIIGVVAIAVDGGLLQEKRRHVQATADAVALAAADVLFSRYPQYQGLDADGAARKQGLATAAANGCPNDKTTAVVTLTFAPGVYQDGTDKGKPIPAGYVEAIVQFNQKRHFSRIFASESIPVRARAVARGMWVPYKNGILVLDPHAKAALNAHGNGKINVPNAPILVNSDHATAAITSGGGTVVAPEFDITGGYSGTGFTGTIKTGVAPTPDPLRYLPPPDPTTMIVRSATQFSVSGGVHILYPGVYQGGIQIQGSAKVTMMPGIYYIDGGGFTYKGQGSLIGLEVMIYNKPTNGTQSEGITGTGGGTVTLTPPTSGIYQGITFFQDRSSNVDVIFAGNGTFNITGTFYAAGALVRVDGNGDVAIGSQYISRLLDLGGNGNLNIPWNPNTVAPTRVLQLVQ
ncbi:MAG: pilus assembly protein TadG-related protein [Gemmataceae bacterium]|nr:pilus assembly protein TadG-related protein [Gemmataceae bacterium]